MSSSQETVWTVIFVIVFLNNPARWLFRRGFKNTNYIFILL